ncbi:unnamed protein product, partial [Closterium sp. NIES-53]
MKFFKDPVIITHLRALFSSLSPPLSPFNCAPKVPDFLCCKITMDIFKDPVITPSGVTYERAVLVDHLKS